MKRRRLDLLVRLSLKTASAVLAAPRKEIEYERVIGAAVGKDPHKYFMVFGIVEDLGAPIRFFRYLTETWDCLYR